MNGNGSFAYELKFSYILKLRTIVDSGTTQNRTIVIRSILNKTDDFNT